VCVHECLCLYVSDNACVSMLCMYVCMYRQYACVHECPYLYVYVSACMHVCVYVYVCMLVCVCVCIYVCMSVCVYFLGFCGSAESNAGKLVLGG